MAGKPTFTFDDPFKQWEEIKRLAEANSSANRERLLDFLRLVEQDFRYREGRSLGADFTKKLSRPTSLSNMGKICREVVKMSPQECLQARLILEACTLLFKTPPLSIAEIADDLGFKDPSYFSRYFKRHAGKAPNLARQEALKGARY